MTAADLAKWDISVVNQSLLRPESYTEMFKKVKLRDGSGTGYGLGVFVHSNGGHQYVTHSGEVSGFTSQNTVVLDRKAAIVVLVNEDAVGTSGMIATALAPSLVGRSAPEDRVLKLFKQLQQGELDHAQFTDLCNAYFTEEAIHDFSASLQPLGEPLSLSQQGESQRGGMTFRTFRIRFPDQTLNLTTYEMPDGKLEQFLIEPGQ